MKLLADLESIKSKNETLSQEVEQFETAVNTYEEKNINCQLEEIRDSLNSFKTNIGNDLDKLNTSSKEFKDLVNDCCNEYQKNEENTQTINIDSIKEIITNNADVTTNYEGSAKDKLTGLPSVNLGTSTGTAIGQLKLKEGNVIDVSNPVYKGPQYNLSEEDIRYLGYIGCREQGSIDGAKLEISLACNLWEKYGQEYSSVADYCRRAPWFGSGTREYFEPSQEYVEAARDVVVNGNRYLPENVVEHDCFSDINSISTGSVNDRSAYIPNETVINNNFESTYVFVGFAPNGGDPFGYII